MLLLHNPLDLLHKPTGSVTWPPWICDIAKSSQQLKRLPFYLTRLLLHQTPVTPNNFYTRHLLRQTHFTPGSFYTGHLLHQTSFYTRHLLHQKPFTPDTLYTRHLLHRAPCTPGNFTPHNFYTRHLLHQSTFYIRSLLHQAPFTPDTCYTKQLLHQTPFYTRHLLHRTSFYTRHLLHQKPFTPDTLYTRHLLHQAPFTPGNFTPHNFYTRPLLHQSTFYTRRLLHQAPFTPDTCYTKQLLHQTPFRPFFFDDSHHFGSSLGSLCWQLVLWRSLIFTRNNFYIKHLLHQARSHLKAYKKLEVGETLPDKLTDSISTDPQEIDRATKRLSTDPPPHIWNPIQTSALTRDHTYISTISRQFRASDSPRDKPTIVKTHHPSTPHDAPAIGRDTSKHSPWRTRHSQGHIQTFPVTRPP